MPNTKEKVLPEILIWTLKYDSDKLLECWKEIDPDDLPALTDIIRNLASIKGAIEDTEMLKNGEI